MPSLRTTRNKRLTRKTNGGGRWSSVAPTSPSSPRLRRAKHALFVIQSLRPQQWVKNLLVFVPLFAAHEYGYLEKLLQGGVAFCAFSLCASGIYVINDWADIAADRAHPVKRQRPIASGEIPLTWCFGIAAVCVGLGVAIGALLVTAAFLGMLSAYVLLATLYSAYLKRFAGVDVLMLAGFYTIRLVAGGIATDTPASAWLLAFSLCFFVSLALVKRYAELKRLAASEAIVAHRRGYRVADWMHVERAGLAIGYLSVVVLGVYIQSEKAMRLYSYEWCLWLICPIVVLWLRRIWSQADSQALNEDPALFAVKDKISWCLVALAVFLVILSRPQ